MKGLVMCERGSRSASASTRIETRDGQTNDCQVPSVGEPGPPMQHDDERETDHNHNSSGNQSYPLNQLVTSHRVNWMSKCEKVGRAVSQVVPNNAAIQSPASRAHNHLRELIDNSQTKFWAVVNAGACCQGTYSQV